MKKFDILTFGSITTDLFIDLSSVPVCKITTQTNQESFFQIPLGEKIRIDGTRKLLGGGSANSAAGFAKLGLHTAAFGVIGDQANYEFIMAEMKQNKIDISYLTMEEGQNSSFSIILTNENGERTVLHERTKTSNFGKKTLKNAPEAKALYIGHLYKDPSNLLFELPNWKKKNNGFIGWNPGKTQFKQGFDSFLKIFPEIDVLIMNVEEAEQFTKIKAPRTKHENYTPEKFGEKIVGTSEFQGKTLADLHEISQKFLKAGIKTLVITDGINGAQIFQGKKHFFSPPEIAQRVNTLGAGDAFSIGVVAAALHGESLENQIRWGGMNAASVIQYFGAQDGQLTLDQIRNKVKSCES